MTNSAKCEVAQCAEPIRSKGLCALHYDRWIRTGRKDVGPTERIYQRAAGRICAVPGCKFDVRSKGLCRSHYEHSIRKDDCPCGNRKGKGSTLCSSCYEATFEPPAVEKICPGCERTLPIEHFGWRKTSKGRTKLRCRCRDCVAEFARNRRAYLKLHQPEIHEQRRRVARAKERDLWKDDPERWLYRVIRQSARMLGLDVAVVLDRLTEVGNRCESCGRSGRSEPRGRVHLDHCHETSQFRGLLCGGCNLGMGHFGDDPARLRAAADYLERRACAAP